MIHHACRPDPVIVKRPRLDADLWMVLWPLSEKPHLNLSSASSLCTLPVHRLSASLTLAYQSMLLRREPYHLHRPPRLCQTPFFTRDSFPSLILRSVNSRAAKTSRRRSASCESGGSPPRVSGLFRRGCFFNLLHNRCAASGGRWATPKINANSTAFCTNSRRIRSVLSDVVRGRPRFQLKNAVPDNSQSMSDLPSRPPCPDSSTPDS